ncbi:hypothetical protein RHGRI_022608 [Rhododendron griersonianum]|uniref:Uncharacterized protein n=1 Tax=Rhododendron griersonianum TaxID=479676 RepID=A0AAV6J1X3_9ERIC|nr:hypothetical protein RHGRI_022608 [Rhododendron griersonianum]
MASGNSESKELALSALVKLPGCHENKNRVCAAGWVPLHLKLIFFFPSTQVIFAKCSGVLETLASNGNGTIFLIDETGRPNLKYCPLSPTC